MARNRNSRDHALNANLTDPGLAYQPADISAYWVFGTSIERRYPFELAWSSVSAETISTVIIKAEIELVHDGR